MPLHSNLFKQGNPFNKVAKVTVMNSSPGDRWYGLGNKSVGFSGKSMQFTQLIKPKFTVWERAWNLSQMTRQNSRRFFLNSTNL